MPHFKCSACGYPFSDLHNFASCPSCGGSGKPNKDCTCTHQNSSFGIKLNVIHKKDQRCPVHSVQKSAVKMGFIDCFGYYFCPKCNHHAYCGKIKEGEKQKIRCDGCKKVFTAIQEQHFVAQRERFAGRLFLFVNINTKKSASFIERIFIEDILNLPQPLLN